MDVRTTVNIDDELLETAREMTGITENATLLRYAIEKLVEREAARRLSRLGGTMPEASGAPRRRIGDSGVANSKAPGGPCSRSKKLKPAKS